MSHDVLCCGRCGHDLRIVCPEHGTEFVPDRRMDPPPAVVADRPPREKRPGPVQRGDLLAKPGTLTEAILLALKHDGRALTVHEVAAIVQRAPKLTGIYLAQLVGEGRVTRVARGVYAA